MIGARVGARLPLGRGLCRDQHRLNAAQVSLYRYRSVTSRKQCPGRSRCAAPALQPHLVDPARRRRRHPREPQLALVAGPHDRRAGTGRVNDAGVGSRRAAAAERQQPHHDQRGRNGGNPDGNPWPQPGRQPGWPPRPWSGSPPCPSGGLRRTCSFMGIGGHDGHHSPLHLGRGSEYGRRRRQVRDRLEEARELVLTALATGEMLLERTHLILLEGMQGVCGGIAVPAIVPVIRGSVTGPPFRRPRSSARLLRVFRPASPTQAACAP